MMTDPLRRFRKRSDRAFTLIELLIVIAIVLILIAIALPNFLEAQTRAKVTRAQGEARSILTAMMAYQVDYREFPLDYAEWVNFAGTPPLRRSPNHNLGLNMCCWALFTSVRPSPGYVLTTPIAYMTAIPYDPFNTDSGWFIDPAHPDELLSVYYMQRTSAFQFAPPLHPVRLHKQVFLWSVGPSFIYDRGPQGASYSVEYSPTNGTKSAGGLWTFD